jgi:hypothetical protein
MIARARRSCRSVRKPLAVASALILAGALATQPAHADDAVQSAEVLFQEARVLVEQGDYAAACPKLEASQKLEPAVGTQFNLADCFEHIGRTASAYALFGQVARIARSAGKFERERSAKERAAALEPKLARIRLDVKEPAPGLEVRIDDALVDKSAWAEPFPVDPGEHRVSASAPSHRPWEGTLAGRASELVVVDVPALVDTTVRAEPPPVVVAAPSSQRTIALVAGAAGVAGVIVGAVSGVVALSNRSDGERECPKDIYSFRCPTEAGTSAWNTASTAGTVSTVGFIAGGVFLAGAAVLWFTAPSSRTRVGTSLTGVRVEGSF